MQNASEVVIRKSRLSYLSSATSPSACSVPSRHSELRVIDRDAGATEFRVVRSSLCILNRTPALFGSETLRLQLRGRRLTTVACELTKRKTRPHPHPRDWGRNRSTRGHADRLCLANWHARRRSEAVEGPDRVRRRHEEIFLHASFVMIRGPERNDLSGEASRRVPDAVLFRARRVGL